MELIVHSLDSGQALATVGPVVMKIITTGSSEIEDVRAILAAVDELLTRLPSAGVWVIVHHGAPLPGPGFPRHAGELMRPYRERVVFAFALPGLGFWSAAASTTATALARLIGVHSQVATDLERSAGQLGMELIGVDPAGLVAAHDELFGRMQLAAPG